MEPQEEETGGTIRRKLLRRVGGLRLVQLASLGLAAAALAIALFILSRGGGLEQLRGLPPVRIVAGAPPPNYVSSIMGLRAPLSVAVTADGDHVYVVEGAGDRVIRRIDRRTGAAVASLAPPGTTPSDRKPMAVAIDRQGRAYVVDRLRAVVDIYDQADNWLGILPPEVNNGPWVPAAVTVDRDGNVYVTSSAQGGPPLAIYDQSWRLQQSIRDLTVDGVRVGYPTGVAVAGKDRKLIIVADSNNGRMVAVPRDGTPAEAYGNKPGPGQMGLPMGLATDNQGRVWVVDATDHSVSAWSILEEPVKHLFQFGAEGNGDGEFLFPSGIAIDGKGRVYITDRENDRIQIWSY